MRRDGARLVVDGRPYRFHGLNYYDINAITGENPYNPGTHMRLGCRLHTQVPHIDESLGRIGPAANAVRGWFFQPLATAIPLGGGPPQRDWSVFDRTLAAVRGAHMRIIVTFTDEFGGCDLPQRQNRTIDWYRSGYRTEVPSGELEPYRAYVRDIVTRYRDRAEILAWQLVSEAMVFDPGGTGCHEAAAARALRSFADDMGSLIKGIDPNHLVSLGTGRGGCGIEGPALRDYQFVYASPGIDLCEYHDYYEPFTSMPAILARALAICGKVLVKPMFVGETGVTASQLASRTACTATLAGMQDCRTLSLRAKFRAQLDAASGGFGEDVAGELVWSWCESAWTRCSPAAFDIVPGDPVLAVLSGLPTS